MAGKETNRQMPNDRQRPQSKPISLIQRVLRDPRFQVQRKPPKVEEISSAEVVKELSAYGDGWSREVEEALAIPKSLFKFSTGASAQFSSNRMSELWIVQDGLNSGKAYVTNTDYGILLYEKADWLYVIVVDVNRKIIVRERLICFQDGTSNQSWEDVRKAVEGAASLAAGKTAADRGLFAVFDGTAKLVKPEKRTAGPKAASEMEH